MSDKPLRLTPTQRRLRELLLLYVPNISAHDRRQIEEELCNVLREVTLDGSYGEALEAIYEEADQAHPGISVALRGLIYAAIMESKYESAKTKTVTSLMSFGVYCASYIKNTPPDLQLTDAILQAIEDALKTHYLNRQAKIVIFDKLLPAGSPVMDNPLIAKIVLDEMRHLAQGIYRDPRGLLVIRDPDEDALVQHERMRSYGFYLYQVLFTVTVPADELMFHHAPAFFNFMEISDVGNALMGEREVKKIPMTNPSWEKSLQDILAPNLKGFQTLVTEPILPAMADRVHDYLTISLRIAPFVYNAASLMNVDASDLVVSVGHFGSSVNDPMVYTDELHLAIAHKNTPHQPFSGDVLTVYYPEFMRFYHDRLWDELTLAGVLPEHILFDRETIYPFDAMGEFEVPFLTFERKLSLLVDPKTLPSAPRTMLLN